MNFRRLKRIALRVLALFLILGFVLMAAIYSYRDRIFDRIKEEVSHQIKGHFYADNFSILFWEGGVPGLTITLENVRLEDLKHDQHHLDFLNVQQVRVRLDLIDLFRRQVQIRHIRLVDGTVNAIKLKDGYANWSIFEPKDKAKKQATPKKKGFLVDIKQVRLENIQVHFADSLHHKWYGGLLKDVIFHISNKNNQFKIGIRGPMHLDGLAFNPNKGSFGTNQETDLKLNLCLDTSSRLLTLEPSRLVFEKKDTLRAHGHFQFFVKRPPSMNLYLHLNRLPLTKALDLMPRQLAASIGKFEYYPEIESALVRVNGSTGAGTEPKIDVRFSTGPARFESKLGLLTNLRTKGHFTNHASGSLPTGNENSRVFFKEYTANWDDGLPVSGKIIVHNFINTRAFITAHIDTDLSRLNDNISSTDFILENGKIYLDAQYRGGVVNVIHPKTGDLSGLLTGKLRVENGSFRYLNRQLEFDQLNIKADFNEKDLLIQHITTRLNKSPLTVKGQIKRLIPFLTSSDVRLYANADIYSPNLNFNAIKIMPLKPKGSALARKRARKQLIAKFDRIVDQLETDIDLRFDRFQYRHFKAGQVSGKLNVTTKKMQIKSLTMNAFNGNFNFSGQVDYVHNNPARLSVACALRNTNVQELFWAFDDFQQQTITHRNIRGLWNSEGKISMNLRRDYTPIPGSFSGYLNFNLRNGELIGFKPIKGIQKFIFKNRNFDHIKFAPLTSQFRFKGREIEMDKMAVESTALTLFVGGTYSFGNQTDLFVQIPLRNLRKRDKDYELVRYDEEHTPGWTLNLRAKDEGAETKIRLDLGQRVRHRKAKRQLQELSEGTGRLP